MTRPLLVLFFTCSCAFAADPRGDNPDAPPSTPQEQLAKFHVPRGFEVQLVADETQIQKPMNLTFDGAGRLWVSGSELYPWPAKVDALGQPIAGFDQVWASTAGSFDATKAPPPPERATDTVRILSDFGPDGRARKVEVFADGLNIPIGLQPLPRKPGAKGDSAIVFSIPNIWHMEDTDGDGRADKKEPLYTGFDFRDTHGMSSNYLYWIDGWIYGCHGFRNRSEVRDRAGNVTVFDSGNTYRFRPDGSQIEHYTHGQTNPFGLTVDPLGNFYSADSHSKPVYMLLRGGYYEGIGKQHDGLGFAPRITDDDHGSSAIAGIAYYAAEQFPEEYRGNLFNGNPVTRRINRDRLEWHGSTPKAIRMPDFLTCDDPWFRPIQVKLGPDGALWIADFYNPIIGHYEFPLADPRRDHKHGRIWRVVWRGEYPGSAGLRPVGDGILPSRTSAEQRAQENRAETPAPPGKVRRDGTSQPASQRLALPGIPLPDLTQLDAAGLVEKLADPNVTVRTLATHEVVARLGRDAAESLVTAALQGRADSSAVLWALERLNSLPDDLFGAALTGDSGGTVLAATQVLAQRTPCVGEHQSFPTADDFTRILGEKTYESAATISRAAIDGLRQCPSVFNILQLLMRWDTPPEDVVLIYGARVALRDHLLYPGIYAEIQKRSVFGEDAPLGSSIREPRFHSEDWSRLAEVSLAVPTRQSAEFLLAHLERTKLHESRSGEFLRHAVLYLPPEKLGAVAGLVEHVLDAPLPQWLDVADNLTQAYRRRGIPIPESFEVWTQRAMIEALLSSDATLLKRGIDAMRDVKIDGKLDPLAKIARDTGRDGSLRIAALEAAANLPASRDVFTITLADPRHIILRKRAAELLVQNGQTDAVLAALPSAPHELALAISAALAKTDAGCGALLAAVESGKTSPRLLLHKAVAGPIGSRPQPLRDRTAALTKDLPPEDARLDTVIAQRAASYAKAKPDATHGAQIFLQSCAACHRFRDTGGNVGPNLDGVAARGAERLIEDILDPSRNVDPLFRLTTVETTDGQTLLGGNLRDQGDTILLADPTGRDLTIAKAKVKKQTASAVSLMPAVFESGISPSDFHDLLAYLLNPAP